jgi:hypothetical protein
MMSNETNRSKKTFKMQNDATPHKDYEFVLTLRATGQNEKDAFLDLLIDLKLDPRSAIDSRLTQDIVFCDLEESEEPQEDEDTPLTDDDVQTLVEMIDWGKLPVTQA